MRSHRFDVQTMPLNGLRLIEASAGTGKTFSLAGLYLRLILEQRASVREILVVTYTRPATQELRERIRRRLAEAARIARHPQTARTDVPEDQLAESLIAASEEPRETVAGRLAQAAHRMDEATITTIHGFSQRAAQENAFDSALPFDRGDQVDDGDVYDEVVTDYWRAHALGADAQPGFVQAWPGPDHLAAALRVFRLRPHAHIAGSGDDEIEALAKRARKAWHEDGRAFAEELTACRHDGALLKNGALHKAIERLGGIEPALEALTQAMASDDPVPLLPPWTAALDEPPTQFKKSAQARGEALLGGSPASDLRRLQPLTAIAALRRAHEAVHLMAGDRKRARRQFSFADMIEALHGAVTDPKTGTQLADALHSTWPWALVDEFQDTDPLQYEILQRVYGRRETGGLILIGDPKQAIYGFRGGDVYAYLTAAADAGDNTYGLDTNFRSTQGLLDAVETLFAMPGDDAFLVEGIDYQHVMAGRTSPRSLVIDGEALAPMTLWHLAPDKPNKPIAERACRDACVTEIRRLLDPDAGALRVEEDPASGEREERRLAPRDIAVLVNTNLEAADMQRALSRLGIGAVCLHQASVFASDEARDVLHVLKAAANPADEGLLHGALTGELLGHRLSDLVRLTADENRRRTAIERFQRAHEAWRDDGVSAMLQPLVQEAAERLLTYEDGERRISNYLQIAELLAGAEGKTFGMAGLLHWLRQAIQEATPDRCGDAEQLRLESDEALVRIVTVHKAKGLEYPVVFLPYAPWLGGKGRPDKPPYQCHDKDNQAIVDIAGLPGNREQSVREARAEGLRLLYVALTRAEIACFLPWGAVNASPNAALASLLHRDDGIGPDFWTSAAKPEPLDAALARRRLNELAKRAPHAIEIADLPDTTTAPTRLPPEPAPAGAARTDLPTPRPTWSIYSFTRLVHATGPGPADAGAEDETSPDGPERQAGGLRLPELPGGFAYGSAVHALLERVEPADWPADGGISPAQAAAIAGALRGHGIALTEDAAGDRLLRDTAQLLRNALHTPLPEIGPLAGLPTSARRPEMEFMLRLGGSRLQTMIDLLVDAGYATSLPRERLAVALHGLMHGFIDLTVVHDGRFHVVDYKTNYLGDHAEDYHDRALRAAVRHHHYDLQYLIYLTALHRHLKRRLPGYHPAQHLGGAYYLFLRGMAPDAGKRGVYFDRPDPALIERLDDLLDARGDAA